MRLIDLLLLMLDCVCFTDRIDWCNAATRCDGDRFIADGWRA